MASPLSLRTLTLELNGDAVAVLTLNRPDEANAINAEMAAELRTAAVAIAHDPAVRAVLIQSFGRVFCGGGDLGAFAAAPAAELAGYIGELLAYTERFTRAEIAAIPDGTYTFTEHIDDDGIDPGPIRIQLALTVAGDTITADFTGTSPQCKGAIQPNLSATKAMVYAAVRCVLDPAVPNNGGYFRPIRVVAPDGQTLAEATQLTGPARLKASPKADCFGPGTGGSGDRVTVPGSTALGQLANAGEWHDRISPLGVTDAFDFGLGICRIGRAIAPATGYWYLKVDHAASFSGADQTKVRRGDEILWYLITDFNDPIPDELALDVPDRIRPGVPFEAKVTAYADDGDASPAAGATVAGVAAAYGPSADPSYELGLAAPYRMIRLVLLRSAAVLLAAVPITVAAGLLLPLDGATGVAWVLPALAFTVLVLGAGSWVDPWAAAVTVGAGWVTAVAVSARLGDVLAVLAPSAVVGYVVLIVAGALLIALGTPAWRLDGQWAPMQPGRERT